MAMAATSKSMPSCHAPTSTNRHEDKPVGEGLAGRHRTQALTKAIRDRPSRDRHKRKPAGEGPNDMMNTSKATGPAPGRHESKPAHDGAEAAREHGQPKATRGRSIASGIGQDVPAW